MDCQLSVFQMFLSTCYYEINKNSNFNTNIYYIINQWFIIIKKRSELEHFFHNIEVRSLMRINTIFIIMFIYKKRIKIDNYNMN